MTLQVAYQHIVSELSTVYDNTETLAMANMVLENISGHNKLSRIANKELILNDDEKEKLYIVVRELLSCKPIQYVLNEAWFYNHKFYVNEFVLIPRQETEELVELIINSEVKKENILDIGTGSGCIPITLKKKLPVANITSIDVSVDAIEVAKKNAENLNAAINFIELDFLNESNWPFLKSFDIIISNPPYIKQTESIAMHKNVVAYEPHIALFVADDDPLIFYKKIASFGKNHLSKNGKIFVEINEALGIETVALFESHGYKATLKKDMQGKDRMIVAEFAN